MYQAREFPPPCLWLSAEPLYVLQGSEEPSNECLTYANKLLCNESIDCMFVTAFYGIYNVRTGEIDYTNAGHNPPYILHHDNKVEMMPIVKRMWSLVLWINSSMRMSQ